VVGKSAEFEGICIWLKLINLGLEHAVQISVGRQAAYVDCVDIAVKGCSVLPFKIV